MNKLAKIQEKWLNGEISKDEFLKIYYETRNKDLSKKTNNLPFEKRKKLHPYLVVSYNLINKILGLSYEIIKDESEPTDRPIIYVPTHIGRYDIQIISVAKQYFYTLLSGDYEHIQGKFDSKFLNLNGIIYFNEKDKQDRKTVIPNVVNRLQNGENIMWFMEGTWNTTPNLLMLQTYKGVIDAAKKANAIIVPIAINQYGKHFKIKIGKNYDVSSEINKNKNSIELTEKLRDYLATLKFEIFSTEKLEQEEFYEKARIIFDSYCENNLLSSEIDYILNYSELENEIKKEIITVIARKLKQEYWNNYQKDRYEEWQGFDTNYINGLIFRPKNVTIETSITNPDGTKIIEIKEHGKHSVVEYKKDNTYTIKRNEKLNNIEEIELLKEILDYCQETNYNLMETIKDEEQNGIKTKIQKINYGDIHIIIEEIKSQENKKNIISTTINGKKIVIEKNSITIPYSNEIMKDINIHPKRLNKRIIEIFAEEIFEDYQNKSKKSKIFNLIKKNN